MNIHKEQLENELFQTFDEYKEEVKKFGVVVYTDMEICIALDSWGTRKPEHCATMIKAFNKSKQNA